VTCDVLVIGAGAAGYRAAIAAHDEGVEVVVLGKRRRTDAHTVLASGGINAALGTVDPEDSWAQHFADTVREGYFLGNSVAVECLVRDAPRAVLELAQWGCEFARLPDGRLDQRFFGAHTFRRTCYAGDYTGRAVLETLERQVAVRGIPVIEGAYVSRLLVREHRCLGALAFDMRSGERTVCLARAVVLATGGYTRLWRMSSSRADENTGDGIHLALQAGCRVADMEQVQFHPTGMVTPEELAGTLVTEAMRGEGARLFNAEGERYMERYDPERLELSSRDRVALANYTEITQGRGSPHGGVFLDITHRSKEDLVDQLPRMVEQFLKYQGIDISTTRVEVAPTAHYSMGGVVVEPERHATEVEGLFAAGEVTAGVHGANRLGGNSLTETVVFGRTVGRAAATFAQGVEARPDHRRCVTEAHDELDRHMHSGDERVRSVQQCLRDVMWEDAGVVRSAPGLARGLNRVAELARVLPHVDTRPTDRGHERLARALDLRASLITAEATLRSALERRESRGAHQRTDHVELDPDQRVNLVIVRASSNELLLERRPVEPLPAHLREVTAATVDPSSANRLLE
jgi:succinate dehydrogenase / fumarate reductase, flavoprotein subunit